MRIGTYNVNRGLAPSSGRRKAIVSWIDGEAVDIWLLTEVHSNWAPDRMVVSPRRAVGPEHQRWAGIVTALPLGELRTSGDPDHGGEEGLSLARVRLDGPTPSVLVACSVLPWKGAGRYWPGLPAGHVAEFRHVLDHHVSRITAERLPDEPLIWGGDFNQQLTGPFWFTTDAGAGALGEAFAALGLVALTERAEHLNGTSHAIDHLAVSAELVAGDDVAEVHRPERSGGQLSDHAAYTAHIRPAVPAVGTPLAGAGMA